MFFLVIMEELNLTETELRYFGDLFLCCDEESNGKIPILKATELFRSSNVSNDVLKQIMELSVPPNGSVGLSHINRKQFYSALKLIAAHQANMPLVADLLSTQVDLPLPRFTWALNSENNSDLIQLSNSPKEQHLSKRDRMFGNNLVCYEPIRLSSNSSDIDIPQVVTQHDNTETLSTDSEVESETVSQRSEHGIRLKNGSPWSTASESPTPTNSVAERQPHPVWENSATGRGIWPANTTEEHTQLLGTEEESSDRHSSEEESVELCDSLWSVSVEQRRHYAQQFAQLQPDARGLLPGHVARLFFEKSRLPVSDLRRVWQLADITKDGALSLDEFTIAMHLIVLRRKEVPLPDVLPACLIPKRRSSQQAVATDLVDLSSDMFSSGTSADFNLVTKSSSAKQEADTFDGGQMSKKVHGVDDSPPSTSSPKMKGDGQSTNKEWTKFVDSPTSSVSSPGPKPVNFDFHKSAVERDPKIFHPVALRVTPDANALPAQGGDGDPRTSVSPRRIDDHAHVYAFERPSDLASPKKLSSQFSCDNPVTASGAEIRPVQRPQPKKPLKSVGCLPPPPAKETLAADESTGPASLQYAPKKEPPPPPPPRPLRSHTRSSSLDLNRLKNAHAPALGAPPQLPPRVSPSTTSPQSKKLINQRSEGDVLGLLAEPAFGPTDAFAPNLPDLEDEGVEPGSDAGAESFADFAHFPSEGAPRPAERAATGLPRGRGSFEEDGPPKRHGAFEVYRKPRTSPERDGLRELQTENALLHRLCGELAGELADVQRERESLRLRLDVGGTAV